MSSVNNRNSMNLNLAVERPSCLFSKNEVITNYVIGTFMVLAGLFSVLAALGALPQGLNAFTQMGTSGKILGATSIAVLVGGVSLLIATTIIHIRTMDYLQELLEQQNSKNSSPESSNSTNTGPSNATTSSLLWALGYKAIRQGVRFALGV